MVTHCQNCPLRGQSQFKSLPEEQLDFLRRFKAGEIKVEPGAQLLLQGSNSPQLFTALEGLGVRYKTLEDGRRQVINFVLPGDFVGLQAGVMKEMQHSVEASTAMTLCVFNRADLWSLFKAQPAIAFDLTWLAAIEESFLGEALAIVGQAPAETRIVWGLLRFHDRCRMAGLGDARGVPFPYRQQDLADALGLSLVHTNKTLQALRQRQILSLQDKRLRMLDLSRAKAMLDADLQQPAAPRPLI
nr:Crp/Fnr family transcriptional regulator [Roseibacterium elongatum]